MAYGGHFGNFDNDYGAISHNRVSIVKTRFNNEEGAKGFLNISHPYCSPEFIGAYVRRFGEMPKGCPRSKNPLCTPKFIAAYIKRFGEMPEYCPPSMNPLCTPEAIEAYFMRFGEMPKYCPRR